MVSDDVQFTNIRLIAGLEVASNLIACIDVSTCADHGMITYAGCLVVHPLEWQSYHAIVLYGYVVSEHHVWMDDSCRCNSCHFHIYRMTATMPKTTSARSAESQFALFGSETQKDFFSRLDRFINGADQFHAFSTLQAINEILTTMGDAINHMLIVGLMAKTIDIGWIHGELLKNFIVTILFLLKVPRLHLVEGKTANYNTAFLT